VTQVDRAAFSVVPLANSGHDLDYWLTRSVEERLQAVQLQREILYGHAAATARLQRVLEIVERPAS
jgi:hypothetical protein